MNDFYYDLHLHSCLSPCGDNDMTPNNIAGMAALKMLDIVALTDHNTAKNCPAFFKACKANGIIPIAGMELTTAEDIHLVCLFETLDEAMAFDSFIQSKRILIKNRVDIFGEQLILDGDDELIGTDEYLLSNATLLSLEEAYLAATEHGAFVYPAHIDSQSNGIIAPLGMLPDEPKFNVVEFHSGGSIEEYQKRFPNITEMKKIVSSDAHYLWDINERENFFTLEDEPYSSDLVRKRLFEYLRK